MSGRAWAASCLFCAWVAYISSWAPFFGAVEEEHDTSSLLQKSITLDSGQSRRQTQLELEIRQKPGGNGWMTRWINSLADTAGVDLSGWLQRIFADHYIPGTNPKAVATNMLTSPTSSEAINAILHGETSGQKRIEDMTEDSKKAVINQTTSVKRTSNQKTGVGSLQTPFVKVRVSVTVEGAEDPLTGVVETREIITEEIEIASTSEILAYHIVVFVPLIIAWSIYFYIGRPRWLWYLVNPITLGCGDQAAAFSLQSLVVITAAPMGVTVFQMFFQLVCTGLWSVSVDRDLIQQEGILQYAVWLFPVTVLYTIYQIANNLTSFKCSLTERTVFINLCPVIIFVLERTVLPDALKPNSTLTSRLSLVGLVVGAFLYCADSLKFTGSGISFASFMMLSRVVYKVTERIYLGGGQKRRSNAFLACIDSIVTMPVCALISHYNENESFLADLPLHLRNPSTVLLLVLSSLTAIASHISGFALLREDSATSYLVIQALASFISVGLGVAFYGDAVFSHVLASTGLVISLLAGLWYSVETYLQKMSDKSQTTNLPRQAA
mmetsp:Transcript_61317/g.106639  ORF Transcript_61317/g.106639 Transcript_61317/m.106639 type:complete len:553 (+) Transcript_61317:81-1739(+)